MNFEYLIKNNKKLKENIEEDKILIISSSSDINHIWKDIESFKGLPKLHNLKKLDLRGTKINSFENCNYQINLTHLIYIDTPLINYQYGELMSIIVFGDLLTNINFKVINPNIKDFAIINRTKILPFLLKNWIIISNNPLKLLNLNTRERKIIYLEKSTEQPIINNQNLIEENFEENKTIISSISKTKKNLSIPEIIEDNEIINEFRCSLINLIKNSS